MKRINIIALAVLAVFSHQAYANNCPQNELTQVGTDLDDNISGSSANNGLTVTTDGRDVIETGEGNDTVYTLGGDDCVDGGNRDDFLDTGDGRDWVFGAQGNDILYAGAGNDHVSGGNNNDIMYGGEGQDDMWGGEGSDEMYGGNGNNTMYGGSGNDIMRGGINHDVLYGGPGFDVLISGGGADILDGGGDIVDSCYGGVVYIGCSNVPDTITPSSDPGVASMDYLDAGEGDDTLVLHAGTSVMALGGQGDDVFRFDSAETEANTSIQIVDNEGNNSLEFPETHSGNVGWKMSKSGQIFAYNVATGKSMLHISEASLKTMQSIKFEDRVSYGVEVLQNLKSTGSEY